MSWLFLLLVPRMPRSAPFRAGPGPGIELGLSRRGCRALQTIRNVVLLFSSPTRSNGHTVPSTIIKNITALSSDLGYSETIVGNITTLSTNYVPTTKGTVQGLLYVPDLDTDDPCFDLSNKYIPANATRQSNLPPTDYILIALAPWINPDCAKSFMIAAALDPLRAMLVYRPDDADGPPPDVESDLWKIDSSEDWKQDTHFPVYAVSSSAGTRMMQQLNLYSGDLAQVPFSDQINKTYSPDPDDYVRVWTQLSVAPDPSLLAIWALVLIILAVILSVIGGTSLLMHYVQNRRRASLRRRVMNGEVNLEALGIKRLTVPLAHIQNYPLFTYNYHAPITSPKSPKSPGDASFNLASPSSSHILGRNGDRLDYQPTCLICLDHFESRVTIIRELSCGHIFHPECIDEFLSEMSSLCPLCKASMYPRGHCPRITNSMVRRELGTRKLRSRRSFWTAFGNNRPSPEQVLISRELEVTVPTQKQPSAPATTTATTRERRMQDDDGRPQCKLPSTILPYRRAI
ncbi:hypothetical protein F4777DRAFT_591773 [Nemania sp. FL0916]|nr:hypothetical protein F4777DRAFT_591773 [Nemania sp. FL0916]